jgi:hypothetical protein
MRLVNRYFETEKSDGIKFSNLNQFTKFFNSQKKVRV